MPIYFFNWTAEIVEHLADCVFDWIDEEQTEIEPRTTYDIDP